MLVDQARRAQAARRQTNTWPRPIWRNACESLMAANAMNSSTSASIDNVFYQ
jgi:hypothetical protein